MTSETVVVELGGLPAEQTLQLLLARQKEVTCRQHSPGVICDICEWEREAIDALKAALASDSQGGGTVEERLAKAEAELAAHEEAIDKALDFAETHPDLTAPTQPSISEEDRERLERIARFCAESFDPVRKNDSGFLFHLASVLASAPPEQDALLEYLDDLTFDGTESQDYRDGWGDCREDVERGLGIIRELASAPPEVSGEGDDDDGYVRSALAEEVIERLKALEDEASDALDKWNAEHPGYHDSPAALVSYTEKRIYRDAILIVADTDYERHVFDGPPLKDGGPLMPVQEHEASVERLEQKGRAGEFVRRKEPVGPIGTPLIPVTWREDCMRSQAAALDRRKEANDLQARLEKVEAERNVAGQARDHYRADAEAAANRIVACQRDLAVVSAQLDEEGRRANIAEAGRTAALRERDQAIEQERERLLGDLGIAELYAHLPDLPLDEGDDGPSDDIAAAIREAVSATLAALDQNGDDHA